MLTDKTLEDFTSWYLTKEPNSDNPYSIYHWRSIPFSMQYGIYVDFFDEKGLDISTPKRKDGKYFYLIYDDKDVPIESDKRYRTRQEAREQAIKQANIYYNQNNK